MKKTATTPTKIVEGKELKATLSMITQSKAT
jgi:hypothetical protein